jgi:trimeric autotransporter adhesin
MSSSLPQTATNSQSLNGIIALSDGVITIEDGVISGLTELELTDLQVSDTATIENLVVNNQIDMTSGKITNLAEPTLAQDASTKYYTDTQSANTNYLKRDGSLAMLGAIDMNTSNKIINLAAPTDDGDAVNKQFLDTNFLNKTNGNTTQTIASRLTLFNTTSGSSNPIINLQNSITGFNKGMYLQFFKNFNRLPDTEIGSIVFADKAVSSQATSRAVQLTASIDSVSNPLLNITFDSGDFNPLTINNTQTILRNNDFYLKNKTATQNLLYYTSSNDFWAMSKSLNMSTNNITNVNNLTINAQIDMTSGQIINLADPISSQDASTKYYTDNASVNTNYLKRDGSLAMTGALNMGTTHKITNLANGTNANDAVNKSQLDLKSDTIYLDTNFFNKTTATAQIVNSNLDMNTKRIYNLANPATQTDAVNLSYLSTNYLNKTATANQTIANKVSFTNTTTDIVSNPVITMFNTIGGASNGNFLRFHKGVVETSNTEIGGLSACDKNIGNTIIRVADLIFSRGSNGEARMDLEMIDGNRNPLRITDGEFTSKNNNYYILKQDGTNLLNYTSVSDKFTMSKPLDMNNNITFGTTNHLAFYNSDLTTESGMKMYFDRSQGSLGRFYMDMRGSEIQIRTDASSEPTSERVKINNSETTINNNLIANGNVNLGNNPTGDTTTINSVATFNGTTTFNSETTINNNLICNGNVNLGNNTTGDTTTIDSVATFNGTTTFNDDVLIEGTNKLSFNNDDLSSANANGMLMRHNGSVGFLDVRGNEFRIRTSSTGTPNTIRFKVNDENTSVINNFFVDGNTTLGNDIGNDTTTFNSKANFPSGSELKFNANSALIFQTGSSATFASGSNTNFQDGANLTFSSNSLYLTEADIQYYNVQIFQPGSYIDGARINLISKTSDFALNYLTNFENGCICNHTSGTLNITMPNTGGASGQYWRRRNYIIKVRETTVKLKRNTTTISTKIDELTGDVTYTTDYKTINLVFDENYHENGQIWIISDR